MADWYKASVTGGFAGKDESDDKEDITFSFHSRRSPVLCRHACVATSQPAASAIGYDFLKAGCNAAETAVAVAAALAVTEPCSTGLGGDMFCLYYDSASRTVTSINGSGKSPANLKNLQLLRERYPADNNNGSGGIDPAAFRDSPHAVTVPGAAQGWQDLLTRHGGSSGGITMAELLEPAAALAQDGFAVGPVTSYQWKAGMEQITKWLNDADELYNIPLCVDGRRAPDSGEVVRNPDMARVLRDLGEHGAAAGFYRGKTGQAIVDAIQKHGGCMTLSDLAAHSSTFPDPICTTYRGCKLWQVPPNGQGAAGLIALAGLQHLEEKKIIPPVSAQSIGGADSYHAMMEMMRLGFADARAHIADADCMTVDNAWLVDADRIGRRAESMFHPDKATIHGAPDASSCTVSFQVVDCQGNAVSFVNSNFQGFGTGIVPKGCGFTLQNRGSGFTLTEGHPNSLAPSKRPFHTIIPGILTHADTNELYATLSNMGGNMQPQGHLQLTVDMLAGNLDPQTAIDMPRFCILDGTQDGTVFLEDGVSDAVVKELKRRGHKLKDGIAGHNRSIFGKAQIIKRDRKTGVLWAGSDGRADGCAIGF